MPLNLADKNKCYIIQRIVGREGVVRRLKSLGCVPGTEIRVLSEIDGNLVVLVKGTKIGLGMEYAKRIIIR